MEILSETSLESREQTAIRQAIATHQGRPGALLGVLEAVQQSNPHKYLSRAALRFIATETGIPAARVYSAATFYSLFNLQAQGQNVISVCRGTACHTRGSRDLLHQLCRHLGVSCQDTGDTDDADQLAMTTADRRFTVRTVACFGQCALAPVVEMNHQILSHVNERTLLRHIDALGQRRP